MKISTELGANPYITQHFLPFIVRNKNPNQLIPQIRKMVTNLLGPELDLNTISIINSTLQEMENNKFDSKQFISSFFFYSLKNGNRFSSNKYTIFENNGGDYNYVVEYQNNKQPMYFIMLADHISNNSEQFIDKLLIHYNNKIDLSLLVNYLNTNGNLEQSNYNFYSTIIKNIVSYDKNETETTFDLRLFELLINNGLNFNNFLMEACKQKNIYISNKQISQIENKFNLNINKEEIMFAHISSKNPNVLKKVKEELKINNESYIKMLKNKYEHINKFPTLKDLTEKINHLIMETEKEILYDNISTDNNIKSKNRL